MGAASLRAGGTGLAAVLVVATALVLAADGVRSIADGSMRMNTMADVAGGAHVPLPGPLAAWCLAATLAVILARAAGSSGVGRASWRKALFGP